MMNGRSSVGTRGREGKEKKKKQSQRETRTRTDQFSPTVSNLTAFVYLSVLLTLAGPKAGTERNRRGDKAIRSVAKTKDQTGCRNRSPRSQMQDFTGLITDQRFVWSRALVPAHHSFAFSLLVVQNTVAQPVRGPLISNRNSHS